MRCPIYKGGRIYKGGQHVYRVVAVCINHAIARSACRAAGLNFGDLLVLAAYCQMDFVGGDFNALSYHYHNAEQSRAQDLCRIARLWSCFDVSMRASTASSRTRTGVHVPLIHGLPQ